MFPLHSFQKKRIAFTLIEMLVVVAIVAALLAFSSPALMRTLQAAKLASAGDALMGSISEAQQVAYSRNVPVELRFFRHSGEMGGISLFRAYQLFKVVVMAQGAGAQVQLSEEIVPVGDLIKLPEGIVIASDNKLSPLISGEGFQDNKDDDVTYNGIQFMPDGSCRKVGATVTAGGTTLASLSFASLPQSFLTVTYDIGTEITTQNLPKNFYTIQIDPFTSKARSYKPGF